MRVYQHFYGIGSPDSAGYVRSVHFSKSGLSSLRQISRTTGTLRTGLLFGKKVEERIEVSYVTPRCSPDLLHQQACQVDPGYILGASDVARMTMGEDVDWIGNWLMYPDRSLDPTLLNHTLEEARRGGLLSIHHILVVLWRQQNVLEGGAYIWGDGMALQIECDTGRAILDSGADSIA